jgi:hypothetical protein
VALCHPVPFIRRLRCGAPLTLILRPHTDFRIKENNMESSKPETIIASMDVSDWTLSQEREFMENLFVGRFNFFLVVFSLFATAGFANTFTTYKASVFLAGALVLFLVWLTLYRGYKKHDRILRIIFQEKMDHPANKIERIMQMEGYRPAYRVSRLMGVYIPWLCISLLLVAAFAIGCGYLK